MPERINLSIEQILARVESWRKRHQFNRDFSIKIDREVSKKTVENLVSKLETRYNIKAFKITIKPSSDFREYFIYLYFKRKTVTAINTSWAKHNYYDEAKDNYLIVQYIPENYNFRYLL